MNDKQKRFVQEYLVDMNATQAAIRAGYLLSEWSAGRDYYVYFLIDPRNQEIFYVGKGKNKRCLSHAKSLKWDHNQEKCDRIKQIIQSGASVNAVLFSHSMREDDALMLELEMIRAIGWSRLTNILPGTMPEIERTKLWAQRMLKRIKPFNKWAKERHRTEKQILMAAMNVLELLDISEHGYQSTFVIGGPIPARYRNGTI